MCMVHGYFSSINYAQTSNYGFSNASNYTVNVNYVYYSYIDNT